MYTAFHNRFCITEDKRLFTLGNNLSNKKELADHGKRLAQRIRENQLDKSTFHGLNR